MTAIGEQRLVTNAIIAKRAIITMMAPHCLVLLLIIIDRFFKLLINAKLVDGLLGIFLVRIEHHRREIRMVGRVGEVLCLKAECTILAEGGLLGKVAPCWPL